ASALGADALGPLAVGRLPLRERLAERLLAREDAALERGEPAPLEGVAGGLGEGAVPRRRPRRVVDAGGVLVDEAVVLARVERALAAARRPEREQRPRSRRPLGHVLRPLCAQPPLDEVEDPPLELVVELGDDAEEVLALDALLVEPEQPAV